MFSTEHAAIVSTSFKEHDAVKFIDNKTACESNTLDIASVQRRINYGRP